MIHYLVGILTGWKMASRRVNCLRTWLPECDLLNIQAVFAFGSEDLLVPELYGRALLLPCPDTYETLPQRTRWLCKWALGYNNWDYLLKCDDDTYVSALRLSEYQPKGEYVGCDYGSFCSGGAGYLMSRKCVEIIANHMLAMRGAEDVIVSRTLYAHGIRLTHDPRFIPYGSDSLRPAIGNDFITAHRVSNDTLDIIDKEIGIKSRFHI